MIHIIEIGVECPNICIVKLVNMKRIKIIRLLALLSVGFLLQTQSVALSNEGQMTPEEIAGKKYFEGATRFENRGPSCITCHSVANNKVIKGGLLAKDLTDVYSRMGEGISAWLMAPPFPAMDVSYRNHALTDKERTDLQAFLKYVNDNQEGQSLDKGYSTMLLAGGSGVVGVFVLISLIWFNRKKKMVKRDIFDRQLQAWDAKH
ncbi:MAG: hypothetical protein H3C31_09675 [Brumimicrobium sp.]|nr:hypothetical protein [Brumimicrobium sp.]MCO5269925.1 cytochrome c [Brumimicrobium sp.]